MKPAAKFFVSGAVAFSATTVAIGMAFGARTLIDGLRHYGNLAALSGMAFCLMILCLVIAAVLDR